MGSAPSWTISIAGAVSTQSAGIRRNMVERGTNQHPQAARKRSRKVASSPGKGTRRRQRWRINATPLHREEGNPGNAFANQSDPPRYGASVQKNRPSFLSTSFFLISLSFCVCLVPRSRCRCSTSRSCNPIVDAEFASPGWREEREDRSGKRGKIL